MDIIIEVFPRSAIDTFEAERAVVILSVDTAIKLALDTVELWKEMGTQGKSVCFQK